MNSQHDNFFCTWGGDLIIEGDVHCVIYAHQPYYNNQLVRTQQVVKLGQAGGCCLRVSLLGDYVVEVIEMLFGLSWDSS